MRRRTTRSEIVVIVSLGKTGKTIGDIGASVGCSEMSVCYYLRINNLSTHSQKIADNKATAVSLHKNGLSVLEIATNMRVGIGTVYRHLTQSELIQRRAHTPLG